MSVTLPCYRLPGAVGAHTRHFMPIGDKTTLVLDPRAVCDREARMLVRWDTNLAASEAELFRVLVERLGYLGRTESWVECEVLDREPFLDGSWVHPCATGEHPGPGWEQVPLLTPVPADEYARWRSGKLATALETAAPKPGKKPTKAQIARMASLEETYPADLLACMQVETGWLQAQGWSQPPGSRQLLYWRPADSIRVAEPVVAARHRLETAPFVLLALATSAKSRSVLPLRARSVPQADLLHRALVSHVNKLGITDAAELVGLDDAGQPLRGHRHAHLLPLTLLHGDDHLDHILVWAPGGLGDSAQVVLRALRKTYMKGGVGELSVRFAGSGDTDDLLQVNALAPFIGTATIWQSYTPLVLPRYRKKSGRNTPEGQVLSELEERGLPAPESIEWLHDESIAMRHFVRARRSGQTPPENFGYAIRLRFSEPVQGPLCLGFGSHFGLGMFHGVG